MWGSHLAPPESIRPMIGSLAFIALSMTCHAREEPAVSASLIKSRVSLLPRRQGGGGPTLQILAACISDTLPPNTVKSCRGLASESILWLHRGEDGDATVYLAVHISGTTIDGALPGHYTIAVKLTPHAG